MRVVVPLKIEALLLLDDNVDGRKQKNPEASVRTGRDAKRLKEAKISVRDLRRRDKLELTPQSKVV